LAEPLVIARITISRWRSAAKWVRSPSTDRMATRLVSMDTFVLSCPRCKKTFSSDSADHLADTLLAHLKAEHGHAPPREHVLARIERHNPST